MTKIQKLGGERPVQVVVLTEEVSFDENGIAEVEHADVVNVFLNIPGYQLVQDETSEEHEEDTEDVTEEPKKAAPTQRKRPSVARKKED